MYTNSKLGCWMLGSRNSSSERSRRRTSNFPYRESNGQNAGWMTWERAGWWRKRNRAEASSSSKDGVSSRIFRILPLTFGKWRAPRNVVFLSLLEHSCLSIQQASQEPLITSKTASPPIICQSPIHRYYYIIIHTAIITNRQLRQGIQIL